MWERDRSPAPTVSPSLLPPGMRDSSARRTSRIGERYSSFDFRYAARTFFDGVFFAALLGVRGVDETFPKVPKDEAKISR
jgi:hypothetical protein